MTTHDTNPPGRSTAHMNGHESPPGGTTNDIDLDLVLRERANFAGLCRLLVEVGALAMRHVFNCIHPPIMLADSLARPAIHVQLRRLRSQGLLDQQAWGILYPAKKGQVNSQHYDATLLLILLKNVCHLTPPYPNGWNGVPIQGDKSISADITRLQWFRTLLASRDRTMTDREHAAYWEQIQDIIQRLGGNACNLKVERLSRELAKGEVDEAEQRQNLRALEDWEEKAAKINNREAEIDGMLAQRGNDSDLAQMMGGVNSPLSTNPRPTSPTSSDLTPSTPRSANPRSESELGDTSPRRSAGVSAKAGSTRGRGRGRRRSSHDTTISRAEMQAHERAVLIKHYRIISDTLNSDDVVPKLVQRGVFTHEEKNRINLATSNQNRMKLVLELLPKKQGEAFDQFCDSIKYKHTTLYDRLVKAKQAPIVKDKPDEVTHCQQSLRAHYSHSLTAHVPIPWHPTVTANLQDCLVPQYITDYRGRKITHRNLLAPHAKCDKPKNVIVEGHSGVGKTTLCRSIVAEWLKEEESFTKTFKLVFHIDLKKVNNDLIETIFQQCLPSNFSRSHNEIKDLIHSRQGDTLFLLDGFEDINNIETDIWDLMHRKLYRNSTVVLTTSPRHVTSVLVKNFDTRLLLLGLQPGSSIELIRKYAEYTETPQETYMPLLEKANNEYNTPTYQLCLNPMNCLCVCAISETKGNLDFTTTTHMMQNFAGAIQKLYCEKHHFLPSSGQVPDDIKEYFSDLEEAAFMTMENNRMFPLAERALKYAKNPSVLKNFGLLSSCMVQPVSNSPGTTARPKEHVYFVSRLIHEFLAAKFMYRLSVVSLKKYIEPMINDRHMNGVCVYYSGLCRFDYNLSTMTQLFDAMCTSNIQKWRGRSHSMPQPADPPPVTRGEGKISDFTLSLECLDECEGRNDLVKLVSRSLPRRLYMRAREYHSSSVLRGLAQVLKVNKGYVAELEMRLDHLGTYNERAIEILGEAIEKSDKISTLKIVWTTEELLTSFVATIYGNNSSIVTLTVSDESRRANDAISATVCSNVLTAGFNMKHLKTIAFTQCKNPAIISSILRNLPLTLESLFLNCCRLDLVGGQELCRFVEHTMSLKLLNLTSVRLKHADFLHFCNGLKLNKSISELLLTDLRLSRDSFHTLSEAIKFNNGIKRLDLGRNNLCDEACKSVGHALGVNKSLLEVILTGAEMSDDGARLIRKLKRDNILMVGIEGKGYLGTSQLYSAGRRAASLPAMQLRTTPTP